MAPVRRPARDLSGSFIGWLRRTGAGVQTTLMVTVLGVPGVAGLLAPLWLFVTGLGLAFGRSTITR